MGRDIYALYQSFARPLLVREQAVSASSKLLRTRITTQRVSKEANERVEQIDERSKQRALTVTTRQPPEDVNWEQTDLEREKQQSHDLSTYAKRRQRTTRRRGRVARTPLQMTGRRPP